MQESRDARRMRERERMREEGYCNYGNTNANFEEGGWVCTVILSPTTPKLPDHNHRPKKKYIQTFAKRIRGARNTGNSFYQVFVYSDFFVYGNSVQFYVLGVVLPEIKTIEYGSPPPFPHLEISTE
jgi:hypothetical protein